VVPVPALTDDQLRALPTRGQELVETDFTCTASQAASPSVSESGARFIEGSWPLSTFLELGAVPSAVGCARVHTRQALLEWGLSELSEVAELLVSELLTNAIQASVDYSRRSLVSGQPSAIMPVRMHIGSDEQRVLIEVWDSNPRSPRRVDPSVDAEHGRGLLLVEAISSKWSWYQAKGWGGKVVWAELRAK